MNSISISPSTINDIAAMVALSKTKRLAYEKIEPKFWRHANDAEITQAAYFQELLGDQDHLLLVAKQKSEIQGFIISKLVPAPAVYDPGGITLLVDDFCVHSPALWQTIGLALLDKVKELALDKGATQFLIICGTHDRLKNEFLTKYKLKAVTQLYTGSI